MVSQIMFLHNEIIKVVWLFFCNTSTLRKYKPPIPCSVLPSDNYLTIKACSRNITGEAIPVYSGKITKKFLVLFDWFYNFKVINFPKVFMTLFAMLLSKRQLKTQLQSIQLQSIQLQNTLKFIKFIYMSWRNENVQIFKYINSRDLKTIFCLI